MTREKKCEVLKAKIKQLKKSISDLEKLKLTQKIPLLKLSVGLKIAFEKAQLEGCKDWLNELENIKK